MQPSFAGVCCRASAFFYCLNGASCLSALSITSSTPSRLLGPARYFAVRRPRCRHFPCKTKACLTQHLNIVTAIAKDHRPAISSIPHNFCSWRRPLAMYAGDNQIDAAVAAVWIGTIISPMASCLFCTCGISSSEDSDQNLKKISSKLSSYRRIPDGESTFPPPFSWHRHFFEGIGAIFSAGNFPLPGASANVSTTVANASFDSSPLKNIFAFAHYPAAVFAIRLFH